MKTILPLLVFLSSFSVWSASESFGKYKGCYKTITFNGTRVAEEPTGQGQSVIESNAGSYLFKDLSGAEIPTVALLLYQGQEGEFLHFDVAEAYLDRGSFRDFPKSAGYSFEGDLVHRNDRNLTYHLESNILITPLSPKRIQVRTNRKTSVEETNFYILELVNCSL